MMAKRASTGGLKADPNDIEDFDATEAEIEAGLAERRARRGRPALPPEERKQTVSVRLSPDVLAALKASGPGWHTRADEMLRKELGLGTR